MQNRWNSKLYNCLKLMSRRYDDICRFFNLLLFALDKITISSDKYLVKIIVSL